MIPLCCLANLSEIIRQLNIKKLQSINEIGDINGK